jgi:hypothetical protein
VLTVIAGAVAPLASNFDAHLVDGRCLQSGDLVLAERLAHDIKPAGQWGIPDPSEWRPRHFPSPVMMESNRAPQMGNPHVVLQLGMYFLAAASSENDQGSMNLASNTASLPATIPSRVAAIHGIAERLTWC